jgi:hypothetical protein
MTVVKLKQRSHLLQASVKVSGSYNGTSEIQAHGFDDFEDFDD